VSRQATSGKAETRAAILGAAARIVEREGARHLTIEAVGREARVSKGGVLYHFSTKQALLEGMLEKLLEQGRIRNDALRETHRHTANPVLRAAVLSERDQSAAERAMALSILAAAAENPELLAPAREALAEALDEAGASTEPRALGWVVLLAIEGLRLLDMLKLLSLSPAERKEVHDTLLHLAEVRRA